MNDGAVTAAFIGAISLLIVACIGWFREYRKDKSTERRSDLDIVLSGYQDLLGRSKTEISEILRRALDCEEEKRLMSEEIRALTERVDLLEGARG